MKQAFNFRQFSTHVLRILAPLLAASLLFWLSIIFILDPLEERYLIEREQNFLREISTMSRAYISLVQREVEANRITLKAAKTRTTKYLLSTIPSNESFDYFWIMKLEKEYIASLSESGPRQLQLDGSHICQIELTREDAATLLSEKALFIQRPITFNTQISRNHFVFMELYEPWDWVLVTGRNDEIVVKSLQTQNKRLYRVAAVVYLLIIIYALAHCYRTQREKAKRALVEQEHQSTLLELTQAKEQLKKITDLLPICSSCKRIRNEEGYWQDVETYISSHSTTVFTHGICPECKERYMATIPDVLRKLAKTS